VLRGGGWGGGANYCRTTNRIYDGPTYSVNDIGFRSVLSQGQ